MHKALLISTCAAEGLLRNQAAYVLATADWETNHTFEPVREAYWVPNAESWRKKNLRYYPWYGRGFVQLTWERNYKLAGAKIGVDLIANPDAAMVPENAARIAVVGMREGWFTGKKLSDFITLKLSNFKAARAIINGTDKAVAIAALAKKYDAELKVAGYGETVAAPTPSPASSTPPARPVPAKSPIAAVVAVLAAIGAAIYAFLKLKGILP